MQSLHFQAKLLKSLFLVILCLTAFNHAGLAIGGDTYQIYLNKKLVLTQHVGDLTASIMTLQLNKSNCNDQLVIVYSHCGVTGKGRNIVVKNERNEVLKEWKYADVVGSDPSMIIPVKDILDLKKNNAGSNLRLYYYASELLPKGLMLTSLKLGEKSLTVNHPGPSRSWVAL